MWQIVLLSKCVLDSSLVVVQYLGVIVDLLLLSLLVVIMFGCVRVPLVEVTAYDGRPETAL